MKNGCPKVGLLLVFSFVSFNQTLKADPTSTAYQKEIITTLASEAFEGRKPMTKGGNLAREFLKKKFREVGLTPLTKDYEQAFPASKNSHYKGINIIGALGKSESNQNCFLIGAHYDHLGKNKKGEIHFGANDNASGIAVMLEMARNLKPDEANLKQCVLFAAFDFEEGNIKTQGGLKGSKAYVKHPVHPLEHTTGAMIFDVVGSPFFSGSDQMFFVLGSEFTTDFYENTIKIRESHKIDVRPILTSLIEPVGDLVPRSDYGPFRKAGVPYLFITSGTGRHYHKFTDTIDRIDYELLSKVTKYSLEIIRPILAKTDSKIKMTKDPRELRLDNLRLSIDLLSRAESHAKENEFSNEGLSRIQSEIKTLKTLEIKANKGPIEIPLCRLQLAFIRFLRSLEVVHVTQSLEGFVDLKCNVE